MQAGNPFRAYPKPFQERILLQWYSLEKLDRYIKTGEIRSEIIK
ncbi:MAG: hypothetical protein ACYCTV_05815 [Leptospirales bacterium]